jgi:hypothetical protein
MPEYKSNKKRKTEESSGAEKLDIPSAKIESRCSVCQHESRAAIDGLIARGTAYAEIERLFGVNARSVNRHADRHLNYEDAAIQEIIRREAEKLGESYEQGVQGALSRRVYLETALKKAQEDLMNGSIIVEPKDAVNVVALLDRMDDDTNSAQIEEIKIQFNAFLQAIRENISPEDQKRIAQRSKEIAELEGYGMMKVPEVIEAQVEEED